MEFRYSLQFQFLSQLFTSFSFYMKKKHKQQSISKWVSEPGKVHAIISSVCLIFVCLIVYTLPERDVSWFLFRDEIIHFHLSLREK